MSTTENPITDKPNRYPGPCGRCGSKIPAGAGLLANGDLGDGLIHRGAVHPSEDACKTTTKTYAQFTGRRRHIARLAALDTPWTSAGGRRPLFTHVDAPAYGSAHGCQVIVGSSHTGRNISVRKAGKLLGTIPAVDFTIDGPEREQMIVDAIRLIAEEQAA